MNVILDVNVLENMLKLYCRRDKEQKSVFSMLLGITEGFNTYRVKDVIHRVMYYNINEEEGIKFSQKLEDELKPALLSYKEKEPHHFILGGITSESEITSDLATFKAALDSMKSFFPSVKNDVLICFNTNEILNTKNYSSVKAFTWKNEKVFDSISIIQIPLKIPMQIPTIQNTNSKTNNLDELHSQLNLLLKRLEDGEIGKDEYNRLIDLIYELENLVGVEEEWMKHRETVLYLSGLLQLQVDITNRINERFIK